MLPQSSLFLYFCVSPVCKSVSHMHTVSDVSEDPNDRRCSYGPYRQEHIWLPGEDLPQPHQNQVSRPLLQLNKLSSAVAAVATQNCRHRTDFQNPMLFVVYSARLCDKHFSLLSLLLPAWRANIGWMNKGNFNLHPTASLYDYIDWNTCPLPFSVIVPPPVVVTV